LKTLLINSSKIAKNPSTAYTRLSIEISSISGHELVGTIEECHILDRNKYNRFIIIGSAFYNKTAEIEAWIRSGEVDDITWINNEYNVSPNSEYARMIKEFNSTVISNCVEKANKVKGYTTFNLLNLNVLLMQSRQKCIKKQYDLIYYGTYRLGRRAYLQKYFNDSPFMLSSTKRNIRKFYQLMGCTCNYCDKLDWTKNRESLNLFRYSLYIEDEYTHTHYNHLANRFYEAIMCNCVQFFDKSCINTLSQSGYEVPDFYWVSDKEELIDKIKDLDFKKALKEQSELFLLPAIQEKKQVEQELCLLLPHK